MSMTATDIYEKTSLAAALAYPFDDCETATNPVGPFWLPDVVNALMATDGNISRAARKLGRKRMGLQRYINSNIDLQEMLIDMREQKVDEAETHQAELMSLKDGAAGRFILQTLGKGRGYSSRTEMTGPDGRPLETNVTQADIALDDLPVEQREAIMEKYLGKDVMETLAK